MQLSLMSCLMTTHVRGRECVSSNYNIYVCGQGVNMNGFATHLGHLVHLQIRTVLLIQQNPVIREVFIFYIAMV